MSCLGRHGTGSPRLSGAGAYGVDRSPCTTPVSTKQQRTRTGAFARVSQHVLPSPDLEENSVPMLDRDKLF